MQCKEKERDGFEAHLHCGKQSVPDEFLAFPSGKHSLLTEDIEPDTGISKDFGIGYPPRSGNIEG